jgi:NAD+-dependent secondary alcohol dehydrogenase Adh1
MKAVRLHQYLQKPIVEEVADPVIAGPLDVIVRIGGAGLCRTDLHIIEGQWKDKSNVALPYTLGHENAGWVHAIGSAVSHVAVGDTVIVHPLISCGFCFPCRAGQTMHCENSAFPGISTDGGFAQFLKTSALSVVKLDPSLAPKDIAALADAGLTAYHAVKKSSALLYPGTTAVVIGAGGLGHIGIQVSRALTPGHDCRRRSLRTSARTREIARCRPHRARRRDADRQAEANHEWLRRRSRPRLCRRGRRDRGRYRVPASRPAAISSSATAARSTCPLIDIISTETNFVGNLVGTYTDLVELMTLTAAGKVTLHTKTYPLEAFNDSVDDLDHGRLQGRGILVPA